MGDPGNRAKKEAEQAAIEERECLRREGWTVFHFDLNPKLTRRSLSLGQAIRELMRRNHIRIEFRRCPVRGLYINYRVQPTSKYVWDHGSTYSLLRFSTVTDEVAAKKQLVEDMLLTGLNHHYGLPNRVFAEQMQILRYLLEAPPSIGAEDWNDAKLKLHEHFRPLLKTHLGELRKHVLGEDIQR